MPFVSSNRAVVFIPSSNARTTELSYPQAKLKSLWGSSSGALLLFCLHIFRIHWYSFSFPKLGGSGLLYFICIPPMQSLVIILCTILSAPFGLTNQPLDELQQKTAASQLPHSSTLVPKGNTTQTSQLLPVPVLYLLSYHTALHFFLHTFAALIAWLSFAVANNRIRRQHYLGFCICLVSCSYKLLGPFTGCQIPSASYLLLLIQSLR